MTHEWTMRAECRTEDPELFFPVAAVNTSIYKAQVVTAKAVCAVCPVQAECLDFALEKLPDGVAGGLTDRERAALRKRMGLGPIERPAIPRFLALNSRATELGERGRELIRKGDSIREVARRLGVSQRTADRWSAQVRAEDLESAEAVG